MIYYVTHVITLTPNAKCIAKKGTPTEPYVP